MILDYFPIVLKKAIYEKASNGVQVIKEYIQIKNDGEDFFATIQEIDDEISASVYGADIKKMRRLSSLRFELEDYLQPKVDNVEDNISNYFVFYNNQIYKISSVNSWCVDIKRI